MPGSVASGTHCYLLVYSGSVSNTTNVLLFKFCYNTFIGVRIIKEMPGFGSEWYALLSPCLFRKCFSHNEHTKTKLNSVTLVRERTIPTERPPPVGEVSANFCG